jgi:hypothetical protein
MKQLIFAVLATASIAASAAAPSYNVRDFGDASPYPYYISNDGRYVVGTADAYSSDIVLMKDGVVQALENLLGGIAGVNNQGTVITSDGEKVRVDKGGVITEFSPFPKDISFSTYALGLNDSGLIAGAGNNGTNDRGFVMDAAGKVTTLLPPSGYTMSAAVGVTSTGDVVGYSSNETTYLSQLTLWKAGSTAGTNLNSAFGTGASIQPVGVSSAGHIIGSGILASAPDTQYNWMYYNGKVTNLGTFAPSYVNSKGQMVGMTSTDTSYFESYWSAETGAVALTSLIKSTDPLAAPLVIDNIMGINDMGDVILAAHTFENLTHTFVLTTASVPEPTSQALMLLGLGAIVATSRRKAKVAQATA